MSELMIDGDAHSLGDTKSVPNKGPFASEEEALSGVVQKLVENLDPIEIWLFGSRAQGTHRPDSDFDLFVVTAPEDGDAGFA